MEDNGQQLLASLVKRARNGDDAALRQLCKELEGFIRGFFWNKFQDNLVVDDLSQETYIRLLRNLPQIKERMKLKSFVTKIVMHVSQDYLRQKYRQHEEALETHYENSGSAETNLKADGGDGTNDELVLNRIDLEDALSRLPEKSREILMMKSQGYNYEEIAEDMALSVSGVKMQIKRTMEELKNLLFFVTFFVLRTTIFMKH